MTLRRRDLLGLGVAAAAAALAGCSPSRRRAAAGPAPVRSASPASPAGPAALPGVVTHALTRGSAPALTTLDALPRAAYPDVLRRLGVPVLCWHQLREPTVADSAATRTYVVSPADFRAQLDELARRGCTPVTLEQVFRHVAGEEPLPRRPVALTFDDASEGHWSVARAELRRRGWPATFFVMTVVLDKPGWLTRDQVRALAREGHLVAAHTWDHHAVTGYGEADWRRQLTEPLAELRGLTGAQPRFFAYPFGEWDPRAFAHLRAAGVLGAWQLSGEPVDRSEPLLTLRRRIVAGQWDRAQFADVLDRPTT